ncbi:MAG: chemotaxis protein [Gammaproteobacteria bacterium]|jgi:chloramphenicol 3-O phosphotransferase|nr:chemotaxis protein [Gammaproteobacteria bacterium]
MSNAIILLHGTSSTGKTSTARTLQNIYPTPLIYLSLDTWIRQCLSPRFYEPATKLEDVKQDLEVKQGTHFLLPNTPENPLPWPMVSSGKVANDAIEMMYQSAINFYEKGYWVVLDHVLLTPKWRDLFLSMTKDCRRILVKMTCEKNLLAEREKARGDRMPNVYLALLNTIHQDIDYDLTVDTSHITPLQAAQEIMDFSLKPSAGTPSSL